jgi:hypothetical protein
MRTIKTDHLITVPSKLFSWKDGTGVTELSDLRGIAMSIPRLARQVWDDSCDIGFVVESELTGKRLLFLYVSEDKDGEGEVTGWNFVSAEVKLGKIVYDFKLLIIND